MILPKIDGDRFVELVRTAPLIAFQKLDHGYAIAAPGEAYYAPIDHPSGGNLLIEWQGNLGDSFTQRMSAPALRTLRPTTKPIPTQDVAAYMKTGTVGEDFYKQIHGDHPAVIEYATQVVIQAIEEHGRPDLQATMNTLKLAMMSETLDLVIGYAERAKEGCELDENPMRIRLHLMQSVQAMRSALELLLKP